VLAERGSLWLKAKPCLYLAHLSKPTVILGTETTLATDTISISSLHSKGSGVVVPLALINLVIK